jgi:hypothetical protein
MGDPEGQYALHMDPNMPPTEQPVYYTLWTTSCVSATAGTYQDTHYLEYRASGGGGPFSSLDSESATYYVVQC